MKRFTNLSPAWWPLSLLALSGCANLAPDYQRPAVDKPVAFPASTLANAAVGAETSTLPRWQELVQDERLRQVVNLALAHNSDLKLAALNVAKAQAALRISQADRLPTVNALLSAQRAPNTQGVQTTTLQGGLQISAWEADWLGRVANLSEAAAASLGASEATERATRLALVAQTISAWLSLAADGEQMALAEKTLRDREATQELSALRYRVGALAEPDWRSIQSLTAAARAAVAQAKRQRQQDENTLHLLVGQAVPTPLLPEVRPGALAQGRWLSDVPAGLASETLLARPDVIQAEWQLRAANANLGAARAAMWPRISLTASAGSSTKQLSDLFSSGTFAWTLLTQATMAVFDSGRNAANQKVAELNRESAVLSYQKTVQTAFREAADGLNAQSTWREQLAAQRAQAAAEAERHRLARLKLEAGATSQLDWLDAERSLSTAQQSLVQVQLAELLNRVALWKALGGDERGG